MIKIKSIGDGLLETIARSALATVVATASACWTARGILAGYDTRISVLESQQQNSSTASAEALSDIRADLREVRAAVLANASAGRER